MTLDAEAGSARDFLGHVAHPEVLDLDRSAAAGADHVVVVSRLAGYVGVLTGRKVKALDEAQLDEEIERPKDRRPTDRETPLARLGDEIGGGEVAVSIGDECRDRAARFGDPDPGLLQALHQWLRG